MFALSMTQISTLSAGAGMHGVIAGTMQGPGGPVAGVRVNVLDARGSVIGTSMTNGAGAYSLDGLPAGTFVVQAVSPAGTVMTTSLATLSAPSMKATTNLTASAAQGKTAPQATAVGSGGFSAKTLWWMVGAGAATAGIVSAVALEDPASPAQ
jgi:hypothetical protein